MEKRELGRTREKIPVIGMGTWEMGDVQNEGRALELQALRRGIELGMTMIDTAEMYGYGNAEKLVGQAIKGMRDEVFIVTKVSPEHFGYDDVLSSCEGSIRRLGVEHIDLYLLALAEPQGSHRGDDEGDGGARLARQDTLHRRQQLFGRADVEGEGSAAEV